jgi:hypothetical protein
MDGIRSAYGGEKMPIEGKHEGKNHLENPGVDGRIILRWILRKWV